MMQQSKCCGDFRRGLTSEKIDGGAGSEFLNVTDGMAPIAGEHE
jgi:hypothetical protein